MNKNSVETITILKFLLTILVVFIHSVNFEIQPIHLSFDAKDIYSILYELISHNIGRLAVPCFFLFSGYFFFLKLKQFSLSEYKSQLQKRMKSLVIPYVIWNLAFILIIILKNNILIKIGHQPDDNMTLFSTSSWYDLLWKLPINYPLWYVRDLICMVLLSPIFYILFKYIKGYGILLLIIIYLMTWELPIPGFSTTSFVFFGAGAFAGLKKIDMIEFSQKNASYTLLLSILMLAIATHNNGTELYEHLIRLFILSGTLSTLYLGSLIQRTKIKSLLLTLSSASFFIYLTHIVYIMHWTKGGFSRISFFNDGVGLILGYFMIPITCAFICLFLYKILKIIAPGVLSFTTGGRMVSNVKKEK